MLLAPTRCPVDCERRAETKEINMSNTQWIDSAGGPLIVTPLSASATWKGLATQDYDEACGVEDYLGLLHREWGDVLVLGDEPLSTAVVHRTDGPAIVRWMYAPTKEDLVDAALTVDLDRVRPVETLVVELRDEPYVIFDAAAEGASSERIEFVPPRGTRSIRTYVVRDDQNELGMIVHRLGG